MAVICPTVTAYNQHTYRKQIERIAHFSQRVHIDLMDGKFARPASVEIEHIWWPVGVIADMHIMHQRPSDHLETIVKLKPDLVIIHAETVAEFEKMAPVLKENHIKIGMALLPATTVTHIDSFLPLLDHVLIFSGDLGSFGGRADLTLLDKVRALKVINPELEIGWDGGINLRNAEQLADEGVDVLNVGGFIHRSDSPSDAYAKLKSAVEKTKSGNS